MAQIVLRVGHSVVLTGRGPFGQRLTPRTLAHVYIDEDGEPT